MKAITAAYLREFEQERERIEEYLSQTARRIWLMREGKHLSSLFTYNGASLDEYEEHQHTGRFGQILIDTPEPTIAVHMRNSRHQCDELIVFPQSYLGAQWEGVEQARIEEALAVNRRALEWTAVVDRRRHERQSARNTNVGNGNTHSQEATMNLNVEIDDGKYEIEVKDGRVVLFRHGEVWVENPLYGKMFIAIAYELDALRATVAEQNELEGDTP